MPTAAPTTIRDDDELLSLMMRDSRTQSDLYRPGPYWMKKAVSSARQIKSHGLSDFRGQSTTIGLSYADNILVDVRSALGPGAAASSLRFLLEKIPPFSTIFQRQVGVTTGWTKNYLALRNRVLQESARIRHLVSTYELPDTLLAGAGDCVEIDGQKIACHYLNLLDQHDRIAETIPFRRARSFFEIGGGFGINVHLLLTNYPIRKVVYLDIVPNLYVGTQYLKAFYGDAVRDYRTTRSLDEISFSADDALEILPIAPWQIELLDTPIDIFQNSHSFVEMTEAIVGNYASHVARLPNFEKTSLVLVSYGDWDPKTSIDPDRLPSFFPSRRFSRVAYPDMLDESRTNYFYLSP